MKLDSWTYYACPNFKEYENSHFLGSSSFQLVELNIVVVIVAVIIIIIIEIEHYY